jgi:hypothetical protein
MFLTDAGKTGSKRVRESIFTVAKTMEGSFFVWTVAVSAIGGGIG